MEVPSLSIARCWSSLAANAKVLYFLAPFRAAVETHTCDNVSSYKPFLFGIVGTVHPKYFIAPLSLDRNTTLPRRVTDRKSVWPASWAFSSPCWTAPPATTARCRVGSPPPLYLAGLTAISAQLCLDLYVGHQLPAQFPHHAPGRTAGADCQR